MDSPASSILLARDLRPASLRVGGERVVRGYRLEDCEVAFARYLPGLSQPEAAPSLPRTGAMT